VTYWMVQFTGKTWDDFQKAGSKATGFRERKWAWTEPIKPRDVLLCYLLGAKRWVGLLEVTSERYRDQTKIFEDEVFPVRVAVKPRAILTPERGVPIELLAGKLSFFPANGTSRHWSGFIRNSPSRYLKEDGEAISAAIKDAVANPVERPVETKKPERQTSLVKLTPKAGDEGTETIVSIPPKEEDQPPEFQIEEEDGPSHTEIQWKLLNLGSQMGLNIWAPKSDRGKAWFSKPIGAVPKLLDKLPTSFDEGTTKTVENIDVLWLKGAAIVVAFEVEHTTTIYSGLLRMSDLLTMQPNLDINLYLVGPDDRYAKFAREVARPTFASRSKPLHTLCGFLPYSKLCARIEEAKNVLRFLKPEFIDEIADFYDPADELD
jgi:hypothetical protein